MLGEPEDLFYWLCLENTAYCQSFEKLLVLICSCTPALEISPLLWGRGCVIFDNSEMGCYLAENVTKSIRGSEINCYAGWSGQILLAAACEPGKLLCSTQGEAWQGTVVSLARDGGFPFPGGSVSGRNVILLWQDGAAVGVHISNGRG